MNFKEYITEKKSWVDAAQWVVKHHQYVYVNQKTNEFFPDEDKIKSKKGLVLLDAVTAGAMVQIMDALSKTSSKNKYKDIKDIIFNPPSFDEELRIRTHFNSSNYDLTPIIIVETILDCKLTIELTAKTYEDVREKLIIL